MSAPYRNPTPSDPVDPEPHSEGITFRDVFLVFVRGLPIIAVVAVVVAVGTWLWASSRPDVFEAEATIVSTPISVQLSGEGRVAFEPRAAIGFDTYQALAMSRSTFERTVELLDAAAWDEVPGFRILQRRATASLLTGSADGTGSTPLTVVHRLRWTDAERASILTNAWVEATVEQIRTTLLADLAPASQNIRTTIADRSSTLRVTERRLDAFDQEGHAFAERRLNALEERVLEAEDLHAELEREIAAYQAELAALTASEPPDASDGVARLGPLAQALRAQNLIPEDAAALLAQLSGAVTTDPLGLVTDLRRTDVGARLEAAREERATVERQLDRLGSDVAALRRDVVDAGSRRTELERDVRNAEEAYEAVAALEPAISFVAELTPANTRVLSRAQVPVDPIGTGPVLLAILAFLAAGTLVTLLVYLREGLRDPAPSGGPRPAAKPGPPEV